jgi:hypothetical protein
MDRYFFIKTFLLCCLLTASHEAVSSPDNADLEPVSENQLKAVYLIHLSDFTTWPAERTNPEAFTICVSSESHLVESLQEVKSSERLVKNKPLKIQHNLDSQSLKYCHIFYVEKKDLALFILEKQQLITNSVLTVSSESGFAEQGGGIEYYLENNKVRLKANLETIKQSRLFVSSKILRFIKTDGDSK